MSNKTNQNSDSSESKNLNKEKLQQMLMKAKLNHTDRVIAPTPCLRVVEKDYRIPIGTMGNFSLITGKAKSRKTFLTSLLVGSLIKGFDRGDLIDAELPEGQKKILYFDTEQGKFHALKTQSCVHRICGRVELAELDFYLLREFSPSERLQMIEHAIESTPNLGFIVIDGIRDLITGINDESQATQITNLLMKWSAEYDIHITCVLHENKGDNNVRGHIGSELVNKAETVISVTKTAGKSYSKVEAKYTRDKPFEPLLLSINNEGIPSLSNSDEPVRIIKAPENNSEEFYRTVLGRIFVNPTPLSKTDLFPRLKNEMLVEGVEFGDSLTKKTINYLIETLPLLTREGNGYTYRG